VIIIRLGDAFRQKCFFALFFIESFRKTLKKYIYHRMIDESVRVDSF
jgi:hypothetical protein